MALYDSSSPSARVAFYDGSTQRAAQILISKGDKGDTGLTGPSGIIVLAAGQAVPAGTAPGTVIFRRL